MEKVIDLLREKNDYLEKFFAVNEHELINFGAGDFDNVEVFYQTRDTMLDLIRAIDSFIEEENQRTVIHVTPEGKRELESLLQKKDEWVTAILAQDLQIIEYIEKEKSNIIRELRANTKAKQAVGAYANVERAKALED